MEKRGIEPWLAFVMTYYRYILVAFQEFTCEVMWPEVSKIDRFEYNDQLSPY